MTGRMAWWVIPGACVVLLRVLTLGGPQREPDRDAVAAPAPALPAIVHVRDAATGVERPLPLAALAERALVVCLPADLVGHRVGLTVWRRVQGEREATPWLEVRPLVRADATVPMLGLPAGRYDVALQRGESGEQFVCDVPVPGRATFAPASPGR